MSERNDCPHVVPRPRDPLSEPAEGLEETCRHLRLFCDILSHDVTNSVWVAENYLRLMDAADFPESKRPLYEGTRRSLAKAREILTDARAYLQVHGGRGAIASEVVNVGALVETTAASLRPLWEEKRQTVVFTLAADALVSAGPFLRDLVSQLLSNAIKFSPPDSAIAVVVSAGPPVRLEVRDRGQGVPEQDREALFRRFERMDKGPIAGVGLGLAIVRQVAQLYGGRVRIEDNPEGGCVFVAEFPAAEATS